MTVPRVRSVRSTRAVLGSVIGSPVEGKCDRDRDRDLKVSRRPAAVFMVVHRWREDDEWK
jgi:hypothetical protein